MSRTFLCILCLLGTIMGLSHITLGLPQAYAITSNTEDVSNTAMEPNENVEANDTGQTSTWHLLMQERFQMLNRINKDIVQLTIMLPLQFTEMNANFNIISKELQTIKTISQLSKTHPIETSMLIGILGEMSQTVTDLIANFQESSTSLQLDLKALLQLVQTDDLLKSLDLQDKTLVSFLNELNHTQKDTLIALELLNTLLKPAQVLQSDIAELKTVLTASMHGLWKAYYTEPTGRLFDKRAWKNFTDQFMYLESTFRMRLDTEIPQSHQTWRALFVRMLLASSVFILLYRLKRFLLTKPMTPYIQGGLRICTNSLFWLCLGFVFYAATISKDGLFYYAFTIIAVFCICFGQMLMAWDIYAFMHPEIPRRSMLSILFILPVVGVFLLFIDLPPIIVTALWLMVLGIMFCIIYYRKKDIYPFKLPRILLLAYQPFIILMGIISFLGFARISIVLCMLYASASTFLQQSVGIITLAEHAEKKLLHQGARGLLWGTAYAFLVPILLILGLLLSILWLTPYPGSNFLLTDLTGFSINLGDTSLSIMQIFAMIAIFFGVRSFAHMGRTFLNTMVHQAAWFKQSLIAPIQTVFFYSLWGLFIFYILKTFGFNLTNLAVVAGGLSIGIGFGMQNIINNFVSGLLIIFGENLREGDVVEIDSVLGIVKKINVRSTTIETFDHAIIFVPNSILISGSLTNWTRNGRMVRRKIFISVAHGTDIQQVLILLQQIADNSPDVLKQPEVKIRFRDFAMNKLNFTMGVWIEDIAKASAIEAQLSMEIEKTFRGAGIDITC